MPTNGKCLLDTNIVIALFASEAGVIDNLAKMDEVFVPSIVAGELYYGAMKSSRIQENLRRIDEFITNSNVLGCDTDTAQQYAKVKDAARLKGRPLPENDIWIAAVALQCDLELIARDMHFGGIENLKTAAW